ncbi:glycerol-3-phosphate acyltransferase [Rubrobacter calidifluminis]|uniref:glycerol-3-phosphate acyltransferase n=1 Tax=Rubrobacter calidifluminis TaxID=1392640 RepID=UPI002360A537|nr:glycerol-3-phosphate acyltransferase [Rubrobacter calidifluminis]
MESRRKKPVLVSLHALGGYLYGSVPFVDLLAKSRGIDLKKAGSKNVGAANLFSLSKSLPLATAAWTLDLSKGAMPPLIAKTVLRKDEKTARMAAAAGAVFGVAGQCWPIFLSFSGGRGVAPIIGASLILAPGLAPCLLAMMASARLARFLPVLKGEVRAEKRELLHLQTKHTKSGPLSVALAISLMPALCAVKGHEREVVLATAANAAIMLLRRLTAQPLPGKPGDQGVKRILINRLLYDRDTSG